MIEELSILYKMETNGIDRRSVEDAAREASERPLDFNPAERAQMIRSMIRDIVPLVRQGKLEDEIKNAYPIYAEKYPDLFKKIVTKQDITPLNTMLSMLDKMAAGTISQHEASIIVGQRLVDRFVKPQLNGSSQGR
jgi:hypothetical protein